MIPNWFRSSLHASNKMLISMFGPEFIIYRKMGWDYGIESKPSGWCQVVKGCSRTIHPLILKEYIFKNQRNAFWRICFPIGTSNVEESFIR